MLGKGTYCYLKPSGDYVISQINSSRNLVLINAYGEDHIGFIVDPEDVEKDLYGNVYPFIFIDDEENKRFYDVVTNTPYSYNSRLRLYIEDPRFTQKSKLSELDIKKHILYLNKYSKILKQNFGRNTEAYKNALLELEKVINGRDRLDYQDPGKPERESRR